MSQRHSEYKRQPNDLYETPAWVTEAVLPHIPSWVKHIWEPACGSGKMATVFRSAGYAVCATDITKGVKKDFLKHPPLPLEHKWRGYYGIITNPPYKQAREFIEHALTCADFVAMMLPVNYDCAKTRQHLFGKCHDFDRKIILTKRIVFFERPGAAPSENHAWYIWDRTKTASATPLLVYAP